MLIRANAWLWYPSRNGAIDSLHKEVIAEYVPQARTGTRCRIHLHQKPAIIA